LNSVDGLAAYGTPYDMGLKVDYSTNPYTLYPVDYQQRADAGLTNSLNRVISLINNCPVQRKFYMSQYLGTDQSYMTSKNVSKYNVLFKIVGEPSYFYGNTPETIWVSGTISITPDSSDGGGGEQPIGSILGEFRTGIK
jgi:hypothetical protein